jgi:hypothetical protein
MKIPNGFQAVIRPEKLRDYLLNIEHKRGKSKAEVLLSFGYLPENWRTLESDLRQYHLKADVAAMRDTPYGKRYEIRAFLETPSSRSLMVRTVWQIDKGTDFPRFITLHPD